MTFGHAIPRRSRAVPKRYSDEFRRKVLDLVAAGPQLPGLNRAEQAELSAANKRIRELETEVAILKEPVNCCGSSPRTWCTASLCDSSRFWFRRSVPPARPPVRLVNSGVLGIC